MFAMRSSLGRLIFTSIVIGLCVLIGAVFDWLNPKPPKELLTWANEIAQIQKAAKANQAQADARAQRSPSTSDCAEFTSYANQSKDFYNQVVSLDRPEEARTVHNEFVESYSDFADADRNYALYVCNGDSSYYDAYASSIEKGNQTSEQAYHDFVALMEHYSISCSEFGLCEGDIAVYQATPTEDWYYAAQTKVASTQVANPLAGCYSWDQVTPALIGMTTCVYGTVYNTRMVGQSTTQILFTSRPEAFFLASGTYFYGVESGDCVLARGQIMRSGSGVPYMNIDEALYKCP